MFNGLLLPQVQGDLLPEITGRSPWDTAFVYLAIFFVAILAGSVINDLSKTIESFFASYGLSILLTYTVLVLPGYTGALPSPDLLIFAGVKFTFGAYFPILLLLELAGSLAGTAVAGSYF